MHSLQSIASSVRTFAFVSDLVEITDLFAEHRTEEALSLVLAGLPANGVLDVDADSDYGSAFEQFLEQYGSAVTRRTTLIVLGDGRGNGNDPGLPAFEELSRRARETVWLTPEPRYSWGLGRCDLPAYEEYCDRVQVVRNLSGLDRVTIVDVGAGRDERSRRRPTPAADRGADRPAGPGEPGGWYVDELVQVRAVGPVRPVAPRHRAHRALRRDAAPATGCTSTTGCRRPQVDDDLAGLLADELFTPGWLRGTELFERIFTGVVRSSAAGPAGELAAVLPQHPGADRRSELARGRRAGRRRRRATAPSPATPRSTPTPSSCSPPGRCWSSAAASASSRCGWPARVGVRRPRTSPPGTMRLLATMAPLLGVRVETTVADAARYPDRRRLRRQRARDPPARAPRPGHGDRTVAEAVRLARRRVVVAVPLEDEADETWGHVRTVSLDDLRRWGAAPAAPTTCTSTTGVAGDRP